MPLPLLSRQGELRQDRQSVKCELTREAIRVPEPDRDSLLVVQHTVRTGCRVLLSITPVTVR